MQNHVANPLMLIANPYLVQSKKNQLSKSNPFVVSMASGNIIEAAEECLHGTNSKRKRF